jgi:hypothetical protein
MSATTKTKWVGLKNTPEKITSGSITTLKELQKACLDIDLSKVHYGGEYYDPASKPIRPFNIDKYGNDYLCVWDANSRFLNSGANLCGWNSLPPEIRTKLVKEMGSKDFQELVGDRYLKGGYYLEREFFQYSFVRGRCAEQYGRNSFYMRFTDACVILDKQKGNILYVRYALDNDYLNEWLRQTIDPNIPNNYEELHAEKEFEVLITTTTYSQEKVKVVGRSYDECLQTMKKNDPMLDVGHFSGRKTTSKKEGEKPIPSSYEEWVSLQEKEVA